MRKAYLFLSPLLLVSCGQQQNGEIYNKTNVFIMNENTFKVANFTDLHIYGKECLTEDKIAVKSIRYAIENSKPDIITLSGDSAWIDRDTSTTKLLCKFMDQFKIPYFFIFGNHDREFTSGESLVDVINKSKYGYIDLGPNNLESQGNYTVKIKNSSDELIHSFVFMDTRNTLRIDSSLINYVENPIDNVFYGSHNGNKTYGNGYWDGVRGPQLEWYDETVSELNCETTLICHIPFLEYTKAYEVYQNAKNLNDTETIEQCAPIGKCKMGEACGSTLANYGFFDLIKEKGSTKNVICGHDHKNDYSLMYEGVRLTYGLKTGDNCYWGGTGTNGYTEITINGSGNASINQIYIDPFTI